MPETLVEQIKRWVAAAKAERKKINALMGPLTFSGVEALGYWEGQIEANNAVLALLDGCVANLGGIPLVYSPDDERHWLKVGLLLERGAGDIEDCCVLILPGESGDA